ncbi:MAG: hypothetical protein K2X56_04625 [Mycobacterium pseudokansasii]|uniref:Uncharacterized protein n=1 Tax=Mycobacterium pseudokansasii TaxID=2341080 RepID=A0A498QV00_9MYCO|nr:hypothetical protein [Mycobacterium pseudokansasii]KZS69261.1 hypothetical protein A4G27_01770 [Mycobacterium kansasii]MBY0387394.1 hypothetical protein [Mycobacterium pseudokansasii]VAZ96347.1 hypothetical protein LAUMK35_03309 [Mycobacterium pseudokansasii]VAZ97737.1 hypothetical protein LAUMK21_03307 [Mycobacterium pseudokansasii]VBA51691.1 hypothetical protein LAUMK142_03222 [Mycobacterium pseudokansasii]
MTASSGYESPFDYARNRPVPLLAGMFVGILSTLLTFGFFWFFAPIFPLFLCGLTMAFKRTKAFSVGAFAAFFGVFTFVGLFAILYFI